MNAKILSLMIALISLSAWAQESSTVDLASTGESADNQSKVEKIPVVGSRIRQMDLEGASPVKVIDREAIENSAAHSVGGILQKSALSPYGGSASRIDVRGMGANRTLVLVNGKRLPKTGGSYGSRATNVNAIPASVVERIEVLSDGASAVYGSEALASVINIVTRKNVDGVAISVRPGMGTIPGSQSTNASLTWGKFLPRGHVSTSFDVSSSLTDQYTKDIDYLNPKALRNERYSDNYSTSREREQAFPNCQEKDRIDGECAWYHGDISRSGTAYRISNFTEYRRDFGAGLTLTADLTGKYAEGSSYSPGYMYIRLKSNEVPEQWTTGALRNFKYDRSIDRMIRFSHRLQGVERKSISRVYNAGVNVGLSGDFADGDWMWSINNNTGGYKESDTDKNMVLIDQTKKVFRENRYNPFEGGDFSSVAGEVLHNANSSNEYFLNILTGNVDGPIYDGQKGSLSMAAGWEWGYHKYRETGDPEGVRGNLVDMRGSNSSGSRTHKAIYAELGANYSQWLESQLALRFEEYSDFGTTLNPKLAAKIKPWERVAFRASVGTGFKAPELSESRGGQNLSGYLPLIDHVECEKYKYGNDEDRKNQYCKSDYYEIEASPNPDVGEEVSRSYNVGVVVEPSKKMVVRLDYWHYEVEDVIGIPRIQHFLKLKSEGKNPNMADYGISKITRDDNGDPDIDKIESLVVGNMGTNVNRGLDLGLDYKINAKSSWNLDYSLMLDDYYDLDGRKESGLGKNGIPRYRYTLSWDYRFPGDNHYLRLERETVGRYKNGFEDGIIPEHSQYNMAWRWNLSPKKGQLIVKANNLFNLHPRYDRREEGAYFDTSLYSGQSSYSIQYKVTF